MPIAPPPFDFPTAQHLAVHLQLCLRLLDHAVGNRRLMAYLATVHWEGQFRVEFDEDHAYSMRRGAASIDRLNHLTRQVTEAISEAHRQQATYRVAMQHYEQQVHAYNNAVEAERVEHIRLVEAQRAAQQRAQQQADDLARTAAVGQAA
jgi:hypothetical protein